MRVVKAKVDCEITGGQLISLDSEEKYNKTLEFMNNICKYKEFYCYFYGTTLMLPLPDKEVSDHVYLWGLDVSSLLRLSELATSYFTIYFCLSPRLLGKAWFNTNTFVEYISMNITY
jgi:hypothetical protein